VCKTPNAGNTVQNMSFGFVNIYVDGEERSQCKKILVAGSRNPKKIRDRF
jgi:hypothetical protein